MSNTTSPVTINLSSLGLGSGFDDANVISQLVAAQQVPITTMQTSVANIASATSSISQFSSDLSALKTAAGALSDPTQYSSLAASSSSSAVVATVATGNTASAGSHSVQVTQLAQAQRTYSDAQSSSTAALGQSGTLSLTINGTATNVNVTSDESLAGIAAAINSSGAAASASVVYDGSQYRLQVQGTATGAANAITFGGSVTLGLSNSANTYQQAQDAEATVDGLAVTSSTNQISGAIPGVTLAVTATTSTPTTVSVNADASSLTTKVQSFITAYNKVITDGHTMAGYGSTAASNTLLQGDNAIETSLRQMSSLVSSTVSGTSGQYSSLGSVGVNVNEDGTLTLDTSALDAAVSANPSAVENVFVNNSTSSTSTTGAMASFSSMVDGLVSNFGAPISAEQQEFTQRTTELNQEITDAQARLATYQTTLQAEFTAMDTTVSDNRTLFNEVGGTGSFV